VAFKPMIRRDLVYLCKVLARASYGFDLHRTAARKSSSRGVAFHHLLHHASRRDAR